MATEAQLLRERAKARQLREQLEAVEMSNGQQTRAYGVRALKLGIRSGTAATAGALADVQVGPVKLRWFNWGLGAIGGIGQIASEPDGAGDVATAGLEQMMLAQITLAASGRKANGS